MKEVNLAEFKSALESDTSNTIFVDVRTTAEYKAEHIDKVKNIPLDEIEKRVNELKPYKKIYLHCQSGDRCQKAFEKIEKNLKHSIILFPGGIKAWNNADYPLVRNNQVLPIMRQVMIAAGSLILIGLLIFTLGYLVGLYLVAFVGCGLLFSGFSGWCGLAKLLGLMPWNR